MENTETRVCTKCGQEKPITEFYTHKRADGTIEYRNYCKDCYREQARENGRNRTARKKAMREEKKMESMLPTSDASDKVLLEFLSKVPPVLLIKSLYRRGYKGTLTYTETHIIDVAHIGGE